jgi:uncharacterized membrane protein
MMLAADDVISVGRFLSAYSTADVQNNELKITYSVFNQQASEVSGTLLTTTLQPGVTFKSATQLPDQNGQELAWSLGTIAPFGRASVEMTVRFAGAVPLVLDDGAEAFGTVDARAVSDDAPEARLRNTPIDAALLASTPDANTTDPFIRAKAAQLDHDPNQIFQFLTEEIGYESYVGSVRGSRGALWSETGNSLDVASLGVALMRSSGIPAQYVAGALSEGLARELILSMFPDDLQAIGYIPDGTPVSDPANDPELLAETINHYWFQVDAGTGFEDADPLIAGATLGDSFTTADDTFTDVPDSLREKTTIELQAEIYSTAGALFGFGGTIPTPTTVLSQTFNDVELVGRPLTFGQFVTQSSLGALVFSSQTTVYSPYVQIGDEAYPDMSRDTTIRGTDFQEVLTNFPFGTQVLTGLFLKITLSGPQGESEAYEHTIVDKIGYAARRGLAAPNVTIDPSGPSTLSPLDLTTVNVMPGVINIGVDHAYQSTLDDVSEQLQRFKQEVGGQLQAGGPQAESIQAQAANFVRVMTTLIERSRIAGYLTQSGLYTKVFSERSFVAAYGERPQLTILRSRAIETASGINFALEIDLRRDVVRVIAAPGQALAAAIAHQINRGFANSGFEVAALRRGSEATTPATFSLNTHVIYQLARDQGIPIILLTPSDMSRLDTLDYTADARARVSAALAEGLLVAIPERSIVVDGEPRVGWYQFDTETGATVSVFDNGNHFAGEYTALQRITDRFLVPLLGFITGFLGGFFAGQVVEFAAHFFVKNTPENLEAQAEKAAIVVVLLAALNDIRESLAGIAEGSPGLLSFYLGFVAGSWYALTFLEHDPSAAGQLGDPRGSELPPSNWANSRLAAAATTSAGDVQANLSTNSVQVHGALGATWTGTTASSFQIDAVNAATATVRDAQGAVVGTGPISLASSALLAAQVTGNNQYSINGSGSLSFYAAADNALGVSGNWDSYNAAITGGVSIRLTTSDLILNGQALPAGIYTISASAATLVGKGLTSTPSFSGQVSITATDAALHIGPTIDPVTVGSVARNFTQGGTLDGYTGSLTVTGNSGSLDGVSINGTAAHVLTVSATPGSLSTDQNTPQTITFNIQSSLTDTYDIFASAPAGWAVSVSDTGQVTVTPAPGLQLGTFPISLVARAQQNPDLVAHTTVNVTVLPTAPGVDLTVVPDPLYFVPFGAAQVPSSFQASVRNLGPAADSVNLTFTEVPNGFTVRSSTTSMTIPAAATGIAGVYLEPIAGMLLPPPGTALTFRVTANSASNGTITDTQLVSFTVPAIHGVSLTADPFEVSTTPGIAQQVAIVLAAAGNVPENVTLTVELPPGLSINGLTNQSLAVGEARAITVTLTPSSSVPLNTSLRARIKASFGGQELVILEIPVNVVAPGVEAVGRAATAARSINNADLANRLDDLGIALTNLTVQPGSEIFKSQAVAALNAVIGLMRVDEVLVGVVPGLTGPRDALAAAVTESEVLAALNQVGAALDGFDEAVTALANSNFELFLLPNSQVALPGTPVQFGLRLHNIGLATSTYNITLGNLPAGVTGSVSSPSVTLDRDGFASNLIVTLTPPANEVFPFEFQVNVAVNGAPQIVKAAVGTLTVRSEFLSVVEVKATPAFVDPGTPAAISARLLNSVNRKQNIRVAYTVLNSSGQEVFAPPPINSSLEVNVTLFTINLADLPTTGLPVGQYTINVRVTDENNNPLPGGTGKGTIFIGSPVTATLSTSPQDLPPGTSTITNTLEIQTQALPVSPPDLLGQVAVAGATDAARNGNFVYVAGSAGISVFNIAGANVENPQFVRVVGTPTNVLEIRNNLLVAVRQGLPNSRLDTYSLTDPSNPQFLGTTGEIPYSSATDIVVTDTHVFVVIVNLVFNGFNNVVLDQPGGMYAVNITNPAAPFFDGDAITLRGTAAGRDGVNDGVLFNDFGTSNDGVGVHAPIDMSGGRRMMWDVVQVSPTIVYLMGSSATGTDTQTGVGQVHVVDISDPRNMRVLRQLAIPGTVHAFGIAVNGNRALVTASEGGIASGTAGHPFTGNIVLATLDISDPANPQIIHTQELPDQARGLTFNAALGNGQYAFGSLGSTGTNAQLNIVDARDPRNLVVSSLAAPANPNTSAAGDLLLTTDRSNLIIYRTPTVDPLRVVGQAAVTGAADAIRNGNFVYVAGSGGISVFDVAGPNLASPQLVRTVAGAANIIRVHNDKLYALRAVSGSFVVSIYSLTDPSNPTLLGATPSIPYAFAINMVVTDTKVYVVNFNVIFFLGNNDIFDHNGAVVTIDVSNPANPQVDGDAVSASGTPAGRDGVNDGIKSIGGVDQSGGNRNTWDAVQLDATTLLVVGSTATGGDTQTGSGIVQVVDTSDPKNLRVLSDLLIPGTVQGFSIAVEGNRALVVASTGGFQDFSNASNNGFTGTVVLATLDITNPRNPLLLNTEVTTLPSRVLTFHESLGNGLFAIGLGETSSAANNSQLFLIDNSNPAQPLISGVTVPSDISRLSSGGGLIYTASPDGLIIYEPSQILAIPVTTQVQIPKNTNVSVVPGSFNVPPDQIISGANFDTLVWNTTLAAGAATKTFTWQSTVNLLQPGEGREVTLDSTIDFTLEGTARQLKLPPQLVAGKQIINMNPGEVTVFSGQRAGYSIGLANPTSVGVTYDLAVEGVPHEFVTLSRTQVFVPPNSFESVSLFLQSDPFAPASRNDFVVTATTGGVRGSVHGTLRLAGQFLVPADPQSHGVVVSLTPATAAAGQGTAANYIVRVTNTGSASDTFTVAVNNLPGDFVVIHTPTVADLPPGASNFRDIQLTIIAPVGAVTTNYPFTVTASSDTHIDTSGEAFGSLDVAGIGVDVDIVQASGTPGSTIQMVVRNTGAVAETFDLSLAGPAALVSTLSVPAVTLGPGGEQTVTINVGPIDFAVPGAIQLVGLARARTMTAISDSDTALITIAGTRGLAAAFDDDDVSLPQPGAASFVLLVDNVGNLEDQYRAEIMGTTGPVTASLTGLDGVAAQSIPVFILPGLATGALLLDVNLLARGRGTVSVQIRSLTDNSIVSQATAGIGEGNVAPVITTLGAGPTASVSIPENTTAVTDVDATDAESLTYSILTGADGAKFTINPNSGILSFLNPPNFENPTDTGGNNVYDVIVQVSDGSLTDMQTISVSVTNVNEPPAITSNGGGDAVALSVAENTTLVADVNATDPDAAATLTYGIIGGADAGKFTINSSSGVLSFLAPPNFESPTDAGGNNVYDVIVQVSDGVLTDTQSLAVTVTDVNERSGFLVIGADAEAKSTPLVKVFAADGTLLEQFLAYSRTFRGGVRVAVGDVNSDGVADVVTAPGRGHASQIKVFDGRTLIDGTRGNAAELVQFQIQAYAANVKDGFFVAVGDVLGDGLNDIIVSPERGKTEVRVFENRLNDAANPTPGDPFSNTLSRKFVPFGSSFCGGATVAAGDMDLARGKQEVIVGSGSGMRTQIKAYNMVPATPVHVRTYLPFANSFRGGVFVAAGDVNGDGLADIVAGAGRGGSSRVEIRDGATGNLLQAATPYTDASRQAAVRVAAKDTDGDGRIDSIFTGQAADGKTKKIRRFDPLHAAAVDFLLQSDPALGGGFHLG